MTDKEKIIAFLEGMSKGCCPNETKEIIINKIIPWINSLPEEPVSEDLEEAMQHNAPNNIGIDDLLYWRNGFIAGAQWQKEQMMKDAVSAYIRRNRYTKTNVLNGFDVTCDAVQKFKDKDKVKVMIIKDE